MDLEQESIVRYWHTVELLQPQSAPKPEKRTGIHGPYYHDTPIRHPIPAWANESSVSQQVLPPRRVWSHTLYAHLYDSRLVAEKLREVYGVDQGYHEPQPRESALFAAKFSMAGHLVERSFVLSSEAWFLGRVLAGKDLTHGFEADQWAATLHAQELLQGPVSGDDLRALVRWVLEFLGLEHFFAPMDMLRLRFRSQPVKAVKPDQREPEDDPLNSFFLEDLATVTDSLHEGIGSEPLNQYLRRHDPQKRLHIDAQAAAPALLDRLMPDAYPEGCWPSVRHLGLVHSQQLAVNTIMSTLSNGQGLLGINGPPGTGKTTLLRDLIAAIVTSRADALSTLRRASDGFVSNARETGNQAGNERCAFMLEPALYGFEIVIASSNNGAVENVTLELPQRDSIDASWLPGAEYFADLGELVSAKAAWGLISAALGSKARRKSFVQRYFYGHRPLSKNHGADGDEEPDEDGPGAVDALFVQPADDVQTMPKPEKNPEGMMLWLGRHIESNRERTPEQRQMLWRQAVADYEAAKERSRAACANARHLREWLHSLQDTRKNIGEAVITLQQLEQKLPGMAEQLTQLDAEEGRLCNAALRQALEALRQHLCAQPKFWTNVRSLWGAARAWSAALRQLEDERDQAKAESDRVARLARQLEASRQALEQQIAQAQQHLRQWRAEEAALMEQITALASACGAGHLLAWLKGGVMDRRHAIELAEPWHIDGWRQARAGVFIQALKLQRTFVELEAYRIRSNLFLANALLTGTCLEGYSRDAIRSAWASLFMVVPVLSSTFASFARSFGSFGPGEIGWLLIDEAGQTSPQAAVGALWRCRRALMVGDPLQLEPIVNVSDTVLEHMRTHYRVDPHWLPHRQSAQTLADQATPWGCMAGPAGTKSWVGLPLTVHRRCDKPMYELANRIAYDGAMVFGTMAPAPDKEPRASLPTGWIQASGPSEGNWVAAEGKALMDLLTLLRDDGVQASDISVITPFRNVHEHLKLLSRGRMACGTIHTMQGKEAPIVILVLGGNTQSPDARNWAVSKPNLLNVAATRARRRFYVIGDRNDWQRRALFSEVMDLLPLQPMA